MRILQVVRRATKKKLPNLFLWCGLPQHRFERVHERRLVLVTGRKAAGSRGIEGNCYKNKDATAGRSVMSEKE
jgi:hypothetical protein